MTKKTRNNLEDLNAASQLVIEATRQVTGVVEDMHTTIASGPAVLGRPLSGAAGQVNALVYGSIRGVTHLVGKSTELVLKQLSPLFGESESGPRREAGLAMLNGVLGDHLAEIKSPLAIRMHARSAGHPIPLEQEALAVAMPQATGKLLVLVHGLCMNGQQWNRQEHDHGAALQRDLGYTPVYLHYNSGLHISHNGRKLDALLERLVSAWPVPVEELLVMGHSMGGLVARSACHAAEERTHSAWRDKLSRLITLGTPHHGAPLERGGNWAGILLGASRYSAPLARLAKLRSAGVTDLRFGNVLDEHWAGRGSLARVSDVRHSLCLPAGVDCFAIAGSTSAAGTRPRLGDGLVPVDSAFGHHSDPNLSLNFPESQQWLGHELGHLDLLNRPEVYQRIRGWLA